MTVGLKQENFVLDALRTSIAIAYKNKDMIADMVMPRVPVPSELFEWTEHAEADYYIAPDNRIGRLSPPNQLEFNATIKTARTVDYGLRSTVPQKDIDNAYAGFDPLTNATLRLQAINTLCRERDVANTVFNAANYSTGNQQTLSGTSQWNNLASTPDVDLLDAIEKPLQRPNVLVLGEATWRFLRRNPRVVQQVFPDGAPGVSLAAGNVTTQQVANWLELDAVYVGRSFVNSSKNPDVPTYSRAWGKFAALLYINPDIQFSTEMITWGFTAEYGRLEVDTYFNQDIGRKGATIVRNTESRIEIVSAKGAGYLFVDAVA